MWRVILIFLILPLWTTMVLSADANDLSSQTLKESQAFSLQHFHWFPKNQVEPQYQKINNLYAKGGALDLLDQITGLTARKYENKNHRVINNKYEGGHSEQAAAASCLLQAPKYPVTMPAKDGTKVTFSVNNIQGLILKVIKKLYRMDNPFASVRNSKNRNKVFEKYLEMFKNHYQQGMPFVVVRQSTDCPYFFSAYDQAVLSSITTSTSNGSQITYSINLENSALKHETAQEITFFQYLDPNNKIISSNYQNQNEVGLTILLVEPVGDLKERSTWIKYSKPTNPFVDPGLVFDIYMDSLKEPQTN